MPARLALISVVGLFVISGFTAALPCSPSNRDAGEAPPPRRAPRDPEPPADPSSIEKATCGGKYAVLLRTVCAPDDAKSYGDFKDWGKWSGTTYKGVTKIPPGYWVYVRPNWYVWRTMKKAVAVPSVAAARSWGPEQACGSPDTPSPGDRGTAWASKTADGQDEWLQVEVAEPIRPIAVLVYENFNPGALVRITTVDDEGVETELWSGRDPTARESRSGISVVPVKVEKATRRIRLHLASKTVRGWNEIDAVGLLDASGTTHWAASATASSTYATSSGPLVRVVSPPTFRERIDKLEADMKALREELQKLR